MKTVPFIIGLMAMVVLIVAGAVVEGHYHHRWSPSTALKSAGEKLASLPDHVGPWRLVSNERLDSGTISMLEVSGYVNRIYKHRSLDQKVSVAVVVGPPGPVSSHIPEVCFSSRAYEIHGDRQRVSVQDGFARQHEFWGVFFRSVDPTTGPLRVLYGWTADGLWLAPDSPRLALRSHDVLYKIQVAASLPLVSDAKRADPCLEFVKDFLPVLREYLIGAPPTTADSEP